MFFSEKRSLFLFVLPVAMSILIVIDYVVKNFNSYYTAPSEKKRTKSGCRLARIILLVLFSCLKSTKKAA